MAELAAFDDALCHGGEMSGGDERGENSGHGCKRPPRHDLVSWQSVFTGQQQQKRQSYPENASPYGADENSFRDPRARALTHNQKGHPVERAVTGLLRAKIQHIVKTVEVRRYL